MCWEVTKLESKDRIAQEMPNTLSNFLCDDLASSSTFMEQLKFGVCKWELNFMQKANQSIQMYLSLIQYKSHEIVCNLGVTFSVDLTPQSTSKNLKYSSQGPLIWIGNTLIVQMPIPDQDPINNLQCTKILVTLGLNFDHVGINSAKTCVLVWVLKREGMSSYDKI